MLKATARSRTRARARARASPYYFTAFTICAFTNCAARFINRANS